MHVRQRIPAHRPRLFFVACCFLGALAVTGCGTSNTVTGKVSYKGTPLRGGTVTFYGPNNWTKTSEIKEDGSYRIEKAPIGTMQIAVETKTVKPAAPPAGAMPRPPADAPVPKGSMYDPAGQTNRYVYIPDDYADKDRSKLTYEVKPGNQEHPIDLQ